MAFALQEPVPVPKHLLVQNIFPVSGLNLSCLSSMPLKEDSVSFPLTARSLEILIEVQQEWFDAMLYCGK